MRLKPKPKTARGARRSLKYDYPDGGRVIVGSMWMPMRIIADTKEQATNAALDAWVRL